MLLFNARWTVKDTSSYYVAPKNVSWIITSGKGLNSLDAKQLKTDVKKCVPLGYPRNDILIKPQLNLKDYFGNIDKFVVWYPTVRQFKSGFSVCDCNSIPIIYNLEKAKTINEFAKQKNILIIVKPHFAQDVSKIKSLALSNIVFIDDLFFKKNNIISYELVSSTDALITDYSSIYYDYLLCNKPIGLIFEDLEEFKKSPGVVEDFDFYTKGGEKIFNEKDFVEFLDRLSQNKDLFIKERKEICSLVNEFSDGTATQHVTDFIIEKSGL